MLGIVSRDPGRPLALAVVTTASRAALEPPVLAAAAAGATIYSDECRAYRHLPEAGHPHAAVNHNARPREFARDDDGDGVREVHCNTMEGIWQGLRNFLRPFRGVAKAYLGGYVAMFRWAHQLKAVNDAFLRLLLGVATGLGT